MKEQAELRKEIEEEKVKGAHVEVMPQIKDGAAEDKEHNKKNKKYILKAMKSQEGRLNIWVYYAPKIMLAFLLPLASKIILMLSQRFPRTKSSEKS